MVRRLALPLFGIHVPFLLLLTFLPLVFFFSLQRFFVRGLLAGSVKG